MTNILETAKGIVYQRSEEKDRQYGDFITSMEKAANICSLLTGKTITTQDMYNAMIAIKLSRQAHSHKEDNLLDCVAYMSSMNDYLNSQDND
jgi:hypothetical protein